MRWPHARLWTKFLFSHVFTVFVGVVTLFIAASAVGPDLFTNQMLRMMGPGMNSIAKELVEAIGGQVWAESAGPGKGSCFSFTLPRAR